MYCPETAFVARFGQRELDQLLGRGDFAGPKTETGRTYEAAAADADAIVDSYLAMRGGITLPIPGVVPPRILELAADLTRYELYDDVKDDETPAAVVVRRKLALEFLGMIAKGEATIPGLFPDPVTASAGAIAVSACPRVFTCDVLDRFGGGL